MFFSGLRLNDQLNSLFCIVIDFACQTATFLGSFLLTLIISGSYPRSSTRAAILNPSPNYPIQLRSDYLLDPPSSIATSGILPLLINDNSLSYSSYWINP